MISQRVTGSRQYRISATQVVVVNGINIF